MILHRLRVGGCGTPAPLIVEVNNSEWGINLVENGQGVGLHHICSVQKSIEAGRLKALSLTGEIRVRADALLRAFGGMTVPRTVFAADKTGFFMLHALYDTLLRADAPEHPITATFIALVSDALSRNKREPEPVA